MQQHWLLVLIFVASTWKRTTEMARLFYSEIFDNALFGGTAHLFDSNVFDLTVFETEIYQSAPAIQVWNGAAWVVGTPRRWSGSAWVDATIKRWSGSAWV